MRLTSCAIPRSSNSLPAQLPGLIAEAAAAKSHVLRFWSVGCATGEEAYSIAALALDAMIAAGNAIKTQTGTDLLPPWRIEVVGSDISRTVLKQARAGIYETGPLSSFRAESSVFAAPFSPAAERQPARPRRTRRIRRSQNRRAFRAFQHHGRSDSDAAFRRRILSQRPYLLQRPSPPGGAGKTRPGGAKRRLSAARSDRYADRYGSLRDACGRPTP